MRRIGSALLVLAVLFSSASCRQTIWVPPFGLPGFDGEESVTYVAYHEGGDYEMVNEAYQVTVKGSDGSITAVDMPAETTGGLKTVTVPGYKNLTLDLYFADYVISTPEQWLAFANPASVCDYGILTGDITVNFTVRSPYENDNSTIYSTSQENTITFTGTATDGQAVLFISTDNVLLDGFTIVSQIEDMNAVKVDKLEMPIVKALSACTVKNESRRFAQVIHVYLGHGTCQVAFLDGGITDGNDFVQHDAVFFQHDVDDAVFTYGDFLGGIPYKRE